MQNESLNFFNKTENIITLEDKFNYIKNHFKYWTMNSWNGLVSIANNVKLYKLGLTSEQLDKAYSLLDCENFYNEINLLIYDSGLEVGFNGRSDGYLVLHNFENNGCAVESWYWDYENFNKLYPDYDHETIQDIINYDFELVKDFDILCDKLREQLIYQIENSEIKMQEYTTIHQRKVIA